MRTKKNFRQEIFISYIVKLTPNSEIDRTEPNGSKYTEYSFVYVCDALYALLYYKSTKYKEKHS